MSTRSYIGVVHDPQLAGTRNGSLTTIHARYVHSDTDPDYLLPTIQAIWDATFRGDAAACADALLGHDWVYLAADTTDTDSTGVDGDVPIRGVGMALGAVTTIGGQRPDEPVLLDLANPAVLTSLDATWLYVLDPATNTIALYNLASGLGHRLEPLGHYQLQAPPQTEQRPMPRP